MTKATETLTAYLSCPKCGEETLHVVLYAGPYIKDIRCTSCGRELATSPTELRTRFVTELPKRARGFAARSAGELRSQPLDFLKQLPSLPSHLVLKGLELSAEMYAIWAEPHRRPGNHAH